MSNYKSGRDALRALVESAQILNQAYDARARMAASLQAIDTVIQKAHDERDAALAAVQQFAESDPISLGITLSQDFQFASACIRSNLTAIEKDVADVLDKAGGL